MGISAALGSSALLPAGLGFRNLLINGAMQIDQRNSASSAVNNVAGGDAYFIDRWHTFGAAANKISATQVTVASLSGTAPSDPYVFTARLTSAASTFTPGVGDAYGIRQYVEGSNIQTLGWGTSNAKQLVLSFWVRSSVTGTYAVAIFNSANDRSFVQTYTVNAANTWEKKTIYITGDSSGTWLTTTGIGLRVWWDLGSGSNFNTTAGTWQAALKVNTSAQANWVGQNAATFYLTGVQLEQNYQPTPFEQRPIGVELALCQRYYFDNKTSYVVYNGFTTTNGQKWTSAQLPIEMRAVPTVTPIDGAGNSNRVTSQDSAGITTDNVSIALTSAYKTSVAVLISSTATGFYYRFTASAEL